MIAPAARFVEPEPFEDFEALVARHRRGVYALALRMMKDPADAEELTQETFLAAWQHLSRFRGDAALGSWLYRICANCCLMRLRRRRPETVTELPGPRFDATGTLLPSRAPDWTAPSAETHALNRELGRALEEATARLPDTHRAVFLLKDVEGLSYEEISQTVGESVPAVKSRLHRARLALREAIDSFYAPMPARLSA